MPRVTIALPSLLARVIDGRQTLIVDADTFAGALGQAFTQAPVLRGLMYDESGQLRPHVLCFLNDVNSRWLDDVNHPVRDGDCITILQAVSGGSQPVAEPPPRATSRRDQPPRHRDTEISLLRISLCL